MDFKVYNLETKEIKIPKKFLKILKVLKKKQIQEILSISFFVGMVCPGKYSLISSIDINLNSGKAPNSDIFYKVKKKIKDLIDLKFIFQTLFSVKFLLFHNVPFQEKLSFFKKRIKKNISLYKKKLTYNRWLQRTWRRYEQNTCISRI